MKKFFVCTALLLTLFVRGQEKNKQTGLVPPIEVSLAFEKQFPHVSAQWSKTYRGEMHTELNFDAQFQIKNIPMSATYTETGVFKAWVCEIQPQALPDLARQFLKREYPHLPVERVLKVTNDAAQVHYEVGLRVQGQWVDAVFNAQGDFLHFAGK